MQPLKSGLSEKKAYDQVFNPLRPILKNTFVLTSVAQVVGCPRAKQKVTGSIPGQGTCLSCGFGPCRVARERQLMDVSLSCRCVSPSPALSLKINK